MPNLDMLFVCHATEAEFVRGMCKILHADISSDSNVVELPFCCFPHPFSSFYLLRQVGARGRDVDHEMRQSSEGLLVGWHIIELLAVPPA